MEKGQIWFCCTSTPLALKRRSDDNHFYNLRGKIKKSHFSNERLIDVAINIHNIHNSEKLRVRCKSFAVLCFTCWIIYWSANNSKQLTKENQSHSIVKVQVKDLSILWSLKSVAIVSCYLC